MTHLLDLGSDRFSKVPGFPTLDEIVGKLFVKLPGPPVQWGFVFSAPGMMLDQVRGDFDKK